ncbi:MAG: hypothetical protein A3C02_02180 [Candidatus Andersenbacteria bacterium RIFCSPHIGHO2_02_FULL_45_11]|nr:MAG: hypothetical protein A2805_02635 [Candidatus Andersenbacteria bacterium RIFCSPHIGHO2_01_FULL_46_36]OGY32536.1 MAG: hypothetical protein A3C02_02180 [Candidatus Andersenbacteria bacterium RIFCSPHIGHO2_02_FULL_45_11]
MLDFAIVQTWHLGAMLAMFVITYGLLHILIARKPVSWRVHTTGKPIYYAGWILAIAITIPAAIFLQDMSLAVGLLGAVFIIGIVGRLDEERKLSARRQLFWQMIIAAWAVWWGWSILHITNPFGEGVLVLPAMIGSVAAFIWFIVVMNAMNFLDGTDGLASLVALITCVALVGVSLLPETQDARTLLLALIAAGGIGAFFLWNAPSARVYLGTSGSWFLGLILGMIAIIGGGKIATVLIVLALPLIDALFVIVHRIASGKPPWVGDTKRHLHHKLRDAGVSRWGILALAGILTAVLGYVGVAAPTHIKIIVLAVALVLFFVTRFKTMRV